MPRKFLKRHLPTPESVKQNKLLGILGEHLHAPNLWHLNRRSVSRAFAVGLWCMYTPPLPWQQVMAAALAIWFEANLPISVALVFITNPLTWPPLYYIAYKVGTLALDTPAFSFREFSDLFSIEKAWQIGAPLLTGCFILMNLGAVLGYYGVQYFWRRSVLHQVELRKFRNSSFDSAVMVRESYASYQKYLRHLEHTRKTRA